MESLLQNHTLLTWLGPTLATSFASIIAVIAILASRDTARKKNSIDTILHAKNDHKLRQAIESTGKIHRDSEKTIEKYAYDAHKFEKEAQGIRYVLNFYEYLSVGIIHKVYDEQVLKESMYSTLVRTFERCQPYINQIRQQTGSNTAYTNFESLALKWREKPISKIKA